MNKRINKNGVSLDELLAVVVIMGIIASIAIPLVGNVIETSKKKAYLGDLITVSEAFRLYCNTEGEVATFDKLCTPQDFTINKGDIKGANLIPEMIHSSDADVFKKYLSKDPSKIADSMSYVYDGNKFYLSPKGKNGVHKFDTGGDFIDPMASDAIDYIVKVK